MHVTTDLPEHATALEALGTGFVLVNCLLIMNGIVPVDPTDAEVVYKLEPPGEEDWKLAHRVMRDGWGDCEDLVFWRLAGLWVTGEDPDARFRVVRTGPGKLHAVIERGDGSYDDPSLDLVRMGRHG